ncbi:MAG: hypothetical protein OPY09_00695 [Nitrosopumilus sp.]|nr:hypothetical protein [Nitrosopumilus sp.]
MPIMLAAGVAVAVIVAMAVTQIWQENPQNNADGDTRDEISWQLLQKTYLKQECREKYIGQLDEIEACFDRIDEEQRLNPPAKPNP